MPKFRKVLALLTAGVFALAALAAAACEDDHATTTASCAFVAGNGQDGHDARLHKRLLPGQTVNLGEYEKISYVPCNSRNYIINDGTVLNANKQLVGDRFNMIRAHTRDGVEILVSATALWTLNQSEAAMTNFYAVCFKYQCASDKDIGGNVNFSTPGWNGMLAENFGPTMDRIAQEAGTTVTDSIWKTGDRTQIKALEDKMSASFADAIRARLGYPQDLFCGSGNSQWTDPKKPGEGDFTCTPVRIQIDEVRLGEVKANDSSAGVIAINQQRLANARALYGANAEYWLALQDTVLKCNPGTTCIFNIGGTNTTPSVPVPTTPPR